MAYGDIMKRRGDFGHDLPLPSGLGLAVAGTVAGRSLECLAPFGRMVSFGAASGEPAPIAQCLPLGSSADAHTAIGERRTIGATVLLP